MAIRDRQIKPTPISLGHGSSGAEIRARKKSSRRSLSLSKLLIIAGVSLIVFYFATSVVIIYNDFNVNEDVLEDETLYVKKNRGKGMKQTDRALEDDVKERGGDKDLKDHLKSINSNNAVTDAASAAKTTSDSDTPSKTNSATGNPLTAFLEPIDQESWKIKPLPIRKSTSSNLSKETYGQIACSTLPQQWPTSEETAPTNKDPFLPWIHDVFPSADGTHIQFVAQNKRRCQSGKRFADVKAFFQPNIALFQHVPVTRIQSKDGDANSSSSSSTSTRYKISSHEEADLDAIETRFICRFKPSMEETLSVHNLNYDYHSVRKAYKATFTEEGFDNHMIWSSQLLFQCPVPKSLQEKVRKGMTVKDDFATDFVDLIPIRTPPRYGKPTTYLPERLYSAGNTWDPKAEWGENGHLLPKIEDSGRWENIPICKPSLMTYPDEGMIDPTDEAKTTKHDQAMATLAENNTKKKLIACSWTSSSFETRGGKTKVNDGDQRLLQWLEFNQMVGVDHVYVYDNSGAFSDTNSLKPVTDLFPGFVTRINWPAKVCNNNPGNRDNKGERSSQYAAAMSCHLRFGSHSDWLASFDTDEYMTPLGKYYDLKDVLKHADETGIKVLNWKSKRSKPRLQYFNTTADAQCKRNKCFDPALPANKTFLEVYNCNIEKPPRQNTMPAEKAIYRTDFVKLFFVHYATATARSVMGKPETEKAGKRFVTRYAVKKSGVRFADEETEGTMLHTKAIVAKEIAFWNATLTDSSKNSKIGIEWPSGKDEFKDQKTVVEVHGAKYRPSCYPVERIDSYWVPKLSEALAKRGLPKY